MRKKVGGWQQLDQKLMYENPWIRVTHENVKRPNNTDGIYGVVHFKNTAVGVIPIDDDGNTWLVKQSRYPIDTFTWEIPEGGSPEGESPLVTAKRELQEEVGLLANDWQELLKMHLSNSVTDEVAYIYVAKSLEVTAQELEDTEDIEVKKLPLTEALQMALNGEITDSLSVAGLMRLAFHEAGTGLLEEVLKGK